MNKKKNKKSKADLHLHTNYSDGLSSPPKMVDTAVEKNLDIIAVTDHNIINGAQIAQNYVRKNKLPIKIIIGEEITTNQGELIGLFLKTPIPPFLSPEQTIKEIKKQNGQTVVPHAHRLIAGYSLSFKTVERLVNNNLIDALEIYNFWDYSSQLAKKRKEKNKKWQLAPLANTDSHHYSTLGYYYTEFQGTTINDLKQAISQRKTKPVFNRSKAYYINRQLHHNLLNLFKKKTHYPGHTSIAMRIKHLVKLLR